MNGSVQFKAVRGTAKDLVYKAGARLVSNGHWVAVADLFADLKSVHWNKVKDESLSTFAPKERRKFIRTPLMWADQTDTVCFVNEETGERAWFKRDYVDGFRIDTLYGGKPGDPFVDDEDGEFWNVLLVPYLPPAESVADLVLAGEAIDKSTKALAHNKDPGGQYACYCDPCCRLRGGKTEAKERVKKKRENKIELLADKCKVSGCSFLPQMKVRNGEGSGIYCEEHVANEWSPGAEVKSDNSDEWMESL